MLPTDGSQYSGRRRRVWARRVVVALGLTLMPWLAASAMGFAGIPDAPQLPAKSYILIDFQSGQTLAENNADMRAEPASLTKIMTVYAVADALRKGLIKLTDQTMVSEHAWKQEGSRMFIKVNEPVSVDQLLHGDIIQSGNDASVALAEHVSGSEETFATVMSQHASRLGMKASHFASSTGLPSPNTYSTARDLSVLARALIADFPETYKIFSEREYTYNGIRQPNRNGLLRRDPTADGIKTGHTEAAGFCLVASAVRDGMRLISVVLGAESDRARTQASENLLNYGFRFFESKQLYKAGATVATNKVWKGDSATVAVGVAAAVSATVPRGKVGSVSTVAEMQKPLLAPLQVDQKVGELIVRYDGNEVRRVPLLTQRAVAEGPWYSRAIDAVKLRFE